jgi:hypothetical protein
MRDFATRAVGARARRRAWLLPGLLVLTACGGGGGSATVSNDELDPPPPPPPPPPAAGVLELEAAAYEIDESMGVVTFVVTRTGGSAGEVSVQVSSRDGTALAGEDYSAASTTATFPDGDTGPKEGNVLVFDDGKREPDETLTLTLANVTGGATIGATSSATVTIRNDDKAVVTVRGTIEGLTGDGLVLRNNDGDDLHVADWESSFTFPAPVLEGEPYEVTVSVQPWNPAQRCEVINGSGTAGVTDVTDVVVSCSDVPLQSLLMSETAGGQADLLKLGEDGNDFVVLADSVDNEFFSGFAGDAIVFTRHTADGGDVYRILPDGSGLEAIVAGPQHEGFGALAGDGALVVLNRQAGVTADTGDVYVIGLDGTGEQPLAASGDHEVFVAVARIGDVERVVYRRTTSGQEDVWSVLLDGSGTVALATSADFEIVYAVTPGGRVVFQRLTPDGYDLYSVLADGTGLVALSEDPANDEFVAMLSDERLLYRREIPDPSPGEPPQYDLYAVNADGTEHATIADSTLSEHYEGLLPGGRLVFSRARADGRDLYAVDVDGTSMATLAAADGQSERFAGVLPDGRVLYSSFDGAGNGDLYLVNPDGSGTFRLTDTPEPENVHFHHYLAGERLVFTREIGSFDDLFSIRFDGSDERRLTDTPDADESVAGLTTSGGVLYLSSSNGNIDLYRIGADGNGFVGLGTSAEDERFVTVW